MIVYRSANKEAPSFLPKFVYFSSKVKDGSKLIEDLN